MKIAGAKLLKATLEELFEFFEFESEEKVLKAIDRLKQAEDGLGKSPKKKKKSEASAPTNFRQVHPRSLRNIAFSVAARRWEIGGSSRILAKLRDINLPLDLLDCHGQTPLFYAAREHEVHSIRLLVENGCESGLLDTLHHQTCIYYAVREPPVAPKVRPQVTRNFRNRRLKSVEVLLSLGCPVDTFDNNGCTVGDFCSNADAQLKRLLVHCRKSDTVWLHQFERGDDKYGIRILQLQDLEEVALLETEFIRDHEEVIERVMGEKPPMKATCASIGLKVSSAERKSIILAIMRQSKKLAKTLVAVDRRSYEICAYLYLKCEENKAGKSVEISHLKVKNSRKRRGIARELFQGVVEYLKFYRLNAYAREMELSVFGENRGAIALYQSLGFTEDRAWNSMMKNWPQRDPTPYVAWRRYSRISAFCSASPSSASTRCSESLTHVSMSASSSASRPQTPLRNRRESISDNPFPTPRASALKRHAVKDNFEATSQNGPSESRIKAGSPSRIRDTVTPRIKRAPRAGDTASQAKRVTSQDAFCTPQAKRATSHAKEDAFSTPRAKRAAPPPRAPLFNTQRELFPCEKDFSSDSIKWDIPTPQSNAGYLAPRFALKRTRSAVLETPRCDKRRRTIA